MEPGLESLFDLGYGHDIRADLFGDGGQVGIFLLQLQQIMELSFIDFLLICDSLERIIPDLFKHGSHGLHSGVLRSDLVVDMNRPVQDLSHLLCVDDGVVLCQVPVQLLNLILQTLDVCLQSPVAVLVAAAVLSEGGLPALRQKDLGADVPV